MQAIAGRHPERPSHVTKCSITLSDIPCSFCWGDFGRNETQERTASQYQDVNYYLLLIGLCCTIK